MKIKRAFTYIKPELDLLRSVNEAGIFDRFRKKEEPKPAPEHEAEGESPLNNAVSNQSDLAVIAGEAARPARGKARWVIYIDDNDLKSYVGANGGKNYLTGMSEQELDDLLKACQNQFSNFGSSHIVKMPNGFTFGQQVKSNLGTNAILLDINQQVETGLSSAKDVNELKAALVPFLSHKNYVMTLATGPAYRLAGAMAKAMQSSDTARRAAVFDPRIVKYYRDREVYHRAVTEWNENHRKKDEKPKEADSQNPADQAEDQLAADVAKGKDQNSVVNDAIDIMNKYANSDTPADQIPGNLMAAARALIDKKGAEANKN